MSSPPDGLLAHLRDGERFLITSHVHPDGDAIGSSLAQARILESLGKTAVVWSHDPIPSLYQPLYGSECIHTGDAPPPGYPEAFDTAVVLECPTLDRCGHAEAIAALPVVLNIDHHLGNDQYGYVHWIDTDAAAVSILVHRIAIALGAEVDADTATLLYLALVTDTGGFRFANTTAGTFEAAADMVRAGARVEIVSRWLYEAQPEAAVRLIGESLATLERHHHGRVATAWLTRDMLTRAGAGDGDSEGLIDYPRSIAGVEAVALFRELSDDEFKVSLRSRGETNVESIARRFGGGGHPNAAGFGFTGSREALYRSTVEALASALKEDAPRVS